MIGAVRAILRERLGGGDTAPSTHLAAPSFAHVFGWVLVLLLGVQAVTGTALAAFYSPSATDAWGSIAYVQDRVALGWFVRGLHAHGSSALMIVAGLHLVQTAVRGAYKRPRELVWWLGLLLLVLVLAFAITGYVLRWDQAGYWANRVEVGIAAGTPVVGETLRSVAIGGNEYGNLTLTRFYALHVIVLPTIVLLAVGAHLWVARRHGATPRWNQPPRERRPAWPHQSVRTALAMALTMSLLIAFVVQQRGADLAAPADPSSAFDARPLWFFRWLFELRRLAGSFEQLAAMAAPAIVGGFLVSLPLLDGGVERSPRLRRRWLGALAGLLALVSALTLSSFAVDAGDPELAKRRDEAARLAARARRLAASNGVPASGAQDVFATAPMWRARTLYAQHCGSCHAADSDKRKGPIISPGHADRAWFKTFLLDPSGDAFWGRTKLARSELAMKPVELSPGELDDIVELMYAQTGATDLDREKLERGKVVFDARCSDCHALEDGVAGTSAPNLAGVGSRNWFTAFIGNPKAAVHLGDDKSEMPRFDSDLSLVERDAIAEYLVWLRSATPLDVIKLDDPW